MKQTTNILICGTGGQGILTMAEIACRAAVIDGYHVKKSEVHGMAQRGGSVESHIRFGEQIFSPLIAQGTVDILVCLDKGEHERTKHLLKNGGKDLFSYFEKAQAAILEKKYLNSAMLGILSCFLALTDESWEKAFEQLLANKNLKENLGAFLNAKNIVEKD
jgi:indolepyruvate ferredoxin oxidoreductase beta subunit